MDQKWEIIYYETSQGTSPIREFIQSLDVKIQNKIAEVFYFLEELGVLLGSPHSKKVTGTPLWELRILGGDNIRIFLCSNSEQKILTTSCFC